MKLCHLPTWLSLNEILRDGKNLSVEVLVYSPLTGSADGSACARDTSRTLCSLPCASGSALVFQKTMSLLEANAGLDPLHTEKWPSCPTLPYPSMTGHTKNVLHDPSENILGC
ncbi:hypothetical protein HPB50_001645 [Hyalomma asiaticum]|uniref:Uncharacterized protein n=1 Tax=Hyalomma asiaticum TaxID=266040 RepID=A0ACB7RR98_HYAAI|nr:hypothetical protein HPB50_001645 [Hyalomma asiaticum]